MKLMLLYAVSMLLMLGAFLPGSVNADENDWIQVTVTYEGTQNPVPYLDLKFTRQGTNDSLYDATNANGICLVMLDDFDSWSEGDYIEIDSADMDSYYVCHAVLYLDEDYPNHHYRFNMIATSIPDYPQPNTCTYTQTIMTMMVRNHMLENVQITRGKELDGTYIQDNSKVEILSNQYGKYVDSLTLCFCPCVNDATYVAAEQSLWTQIKWTVEIKRTTQQWEDATSYTTGPCDFWVYHDQPCNENGPNILVTLDNPLEYCAYHYDFRVKSIIIKADDIEGELTYPDDCEEPGPEESYYTITNINFSYIE